MATLHTRNSQGVKTDMSPFHDEAIDNRTSTAVLRQHRSHLTRIEAMAAKTKAESPWVEDGEILWAV